MRRAGDRLMTILAWALWLVSLAFAGLYGTWMTWAIVGTSLALIATVLFLLIPGTRGSRIGIALVLMGFAALPYTRLSEPSKPTSPSSLCSPSFFTTATGAPSSRPHLPSPSTTLSSAGWR